MLSLCSYLQFPKLFDIPATYFSIASYNLAVVISTMSTQEKVVRQLKPTIIYSLDHDLLPTAEFTAERLIAQNKKNPECVFLYALVLYKCHRYKAAYNWTSDYCATDVKCSYIFAKSCLHLEEKSDGISSLTRTLSIWSGIRQEDACRYEPDQVSCYMLLAKLYGLVGDLKRCALNYAQVLKINPYIFEAFEELCKMGAKVRVNHLYHPISPVSDIRSNLFQSYMHKNSTSSLSSSSSLSNEGSDQDKPRHKQGNTDDEVHGEEGTNLFKTPVAKTRVRTYEVDPLSGIDQDKGIVNQHEANTNTPKGARSLHYNEEKPASKRRISDSSSKWRSRKIASSITSRLLSHPFNARSGAFSDTAGYKMRNAGSPFRENAKSPVSGSKRSLHSLQTRPNERFVTDDRVDSILKSMNNDYLSSVYSKLAKGFRAMCAYDCFRAIRIFNSLPEAEQNTPWVLAKLGRLHFEIVNYEEAEKFYLKLRKLDRTRVCDMEYYSTLLWHLQKEVDLSFLCHELYEVDTKAPQTWICIGNLYSLQKEPDEAIKCFQRAIRLDKGFVYAYTLQGHEYLANDAFENAMDCFRHAISLDRRHYNAFYGIGMVYLKLGDFMKAEFHFRKAAEINPVNVILICCIGMVLEKMEKQEEALEQYTFALKLQPLSMLALFKKAQVLFSLKQYQPALESFQKLEDMAPDEASVHFLLGKLYNYYGKKNQAVKEFTTAMNLDPKGSHLIKEALENLRRD